MKLLTKEIINEFKKVGSQEQVEDPIVIARFFNPTGIGTWYATEFDEGEQMFFGYVSLFGDYNDEWGYFSLAELQDFKGRFGLGIERDLHFEPKKISECGIRSLKWTSTTKHTKVKVDLDELITCLHFGKNGEIQ